MVSIFTYRDERKLFAVIGTVVVAAVIALVQLDALKTGKPSVLTVGTTTVATILETGATGIANAVRAGASAVHDAPGYYALDRTLAQQNVALRAENARLREAVEAAPAARALERASANEPGAIEAAVVGYDPENLSRTVVVDRGSDAGVVVDDGVLGDAGVVGRVVAVGLRSSTVLLLTDVGSNVPAVVQRGRYWGIAVGTGANVGLKYVSQDARVRVGDRVVTGRGRSFRAGIPIGRIARVVRPGGALYVGAVLDPAVDFGRLERVLVVPRTP